MVLTFEEDRVTVPSRWTHEPQASHSEPEILSSIRRYRRVLELLSAATCPYMVLMVIYFIVMFVNRKIVTLYSAFILEQAALYNK